MQDQIFELLFEKDDITWQTILYDLVRSEKMNPWDIDISLLSNKYLELIKTMKKFDFKVSGKVILASAILLKLKSDRLMDQDLMYLDSLLHPEEESILYEDEDGLLPTIHDIPKLTPRTPQPRKRKVSIYDLVDALQKALEVKKRRVMRTVPPARVDVPEKKININSVIRKMHHKILSFFAKNQNKKLTFTQLIPSPSKKDKVLTFIPLLHLTTDRKIDLMQEQHFGEIEILLKKVQNETKKSVAAEIPGTADA